MKDTNRKLMPQFIQNALQFGKYAIRNIPSPKWLKSKRQHEVGSGISSITDGMVSYKAACDAAVDDDRAFDRFRRDPEITAIIETMDGDTGAECLQIAVTTNPDIVSAFSRFRTSENYGDPVVHPMGEYGEFAGTTARYIYYLTEMIELFGSLDGMNIVEIGGGYGGQCKIIHDYFQPGGYTIVDLQPALGLATKYLGKFGYENVEFRTSDELSEDLKFDLAISNYAFTECTEDIQNHYLDRILKKSSRGYLACNFLQKNLGFRRYSKKRLLAEIPTSEERPHIPEYPGNWIWVWGF
jgi:hypothetical protein